MSSPPSCAGLFSLVSLASSAILSPLLPSYLLGHEYAGKTTLLHNLQAWSNPRNTYPPERVSSEERTSGLEVHHLDNFWSSGLELVMMDFGGHSVYHAAHEFFMVEGNTVFVIVLSGMEPPCGEFLKLRCPVSPISFSCSHPLPSGRDWE